MATKADRYLWRRNYSIYNCHLFPFFPVEMALFQVNEEGAKAGAAHERATRKDQGDEAKRPSPEGVAGRAAALDERREPAWRLSPIAHSNALSLCSLQSHHYLS